MLRYKFRFNSFLSEALYMSLFMRIIIIIIIIIIIMIIIIIVSGGGGGLLKLFKCNFLEELKVAFATVRSAKLMLERLKIQKKTARFCSFRPTDR